MVGVGETIGEGVASCPTGEMKSLVAGLSPKGRGLTLGVLKGSTFLDFAGRKFWAIAYPPPRRDITAIATTTAIGTKPVFTTALSPSYAYRIAPVNVTIPPILFMIWLILAIALVLRLIAMNQSLWLDEAINVNNAAALDLKSLVLNYSLGDFHPPLYHILLRGWILVFGSSEIAVRIPSIILGVSTVYLTYLIGKKLFEGKTALIGATLMATAPLHIYYSQEARMYALAAFLASLSVYFFISILKKDTLSSWLGFIASTTLMLYSDYLPYFLIPVYIIYLVFERKIVGKATHRAFIPAFLIIFIFLIPWLLIFPKQISVGLSAAAASPAWAQVVGSHEIKNLLITPAKFTIGRISNDNNLTYALLFAPAGIFITFLFLISLFRMSHLRSFLAYWLFGPIILAYLASFFIPIFAYFRLIFVLPAFYLIIASAINIVNWPLLTRFFLAIALSINLLSASIYFLNPKFQRENWRDAVAYVHQNSTPQTVVLFESNYSVGPFDYYNHGKVKAAGALGNFSIKELTNGRNKVFLFQYLSGITDPQGLVFKELSSRGFTNTDTRDFSGVGFIYEFTK